MEKWTIKPDPTSFDPMRHVLLLKGNMKDVSTVLRRFGAICGRPSSENTPDGYNFSVPLHGVNAAMMDRLNVALRDLAPAGGGPVSTAQIAVAPAPVAMPTPPPSGPIFSEPPAPAIPLPPVDLAPPPAPEPPPQLMSLSPEPAPTPAPTPAPEPAAPAGPVFTEPEPQLEQTPEREAASFGFVRPLDPMQTFDTLSVGPYNRFAHAAATSVVSAPGAMYNPLFLYGAPGTGKTHCLHAIGKELSGALGNGTVLYTTGGRLSSAVTAALTAGTVSKLRESLSKAKALIVDDVHLVAVTEDNRSTLAQIFAQFFSNGLQVVLSSIYPPRALSALEEALKIALSKGWAVDLKVPSPASQLEIVSSWLGRHDCPLGVDEVRVFHERLGAANYPEALRWMRRLLTMLRLLQEKAQEAQPLAVLNMLFDPGVAATDFPSASELELTKGFQPPEPQGRAINLALIVPKGHENMAGWVASGFYQAAAQYGITPNYRHVLLQAYDASQPYGVPFQIGEACRQAGAQAALVVGPPNDSSLAAKGAEFYHAVAHVLESLDVSCGWVGHRSTMAPSHYLRAHLDILAGKQ